MTVFESASAFSALVTALMIRKSDAAEMTAARHLGEVIDDWATAGPGWAVGWAVGGARAHFFLSRSILGASCSW